MTRKYSKIINRKEKERNEVIDLTDTSRHNHTPVIRELETNPVTGCVTIRSITDDSDGGSHGQGSAFNDTPIHFIEEDRGTALPSDEPDLPDPDGDFEEKLEAEGAFIIDSTTHYPASKTTVTKRSQTPAEIAEERGYMYNI